MHGLIVIITSTVAYLAGSLQGYYWWGHKFNREIAKALGILF